MSILKLNVKRAPERSTIFETQRLSISNDFLSFWTEKNPKDGH